MSNLFDSYYQVDDKKFYNIWQAFDHQIKTNAFPQYVLDQEFVDGIKNCKRPKNLDAQYIKTLIVDRLKKLRKKYKYMRLALGGGTDSYSILKYCLENDIYIDEVFTHMISLVPDVRSNIEYLPAIRHAKNFEGKSIGKVIQIYPTIQDCEFPTVPGWYKNDNFTRGRHLPVRPSVPSSYYKKTDLPIKESITIFGFEKPYVINENGNLYWVTLDTSMSELMNCDNLLPLFYDRENPELTVCMTYSLIENSDTSQKYIGYDLQPVERKTKILHAMGLESTGHYFIDNHIQGKTMFEFDNIKNRLYHKQLQTQGRQDIIDAYFKTHKIIILQYRNLPHAIEIHDNKYVKSTLRLSEKIPILQDSFGS